MPRSVTRSRTRRAHSSVALIPTPAVLRCVRHAALAGLALVLVWPAARGSSEWIGWLPLWLVGMPLVAWWAVVGFPLPQRRRRRLQARRVHAGPARRAARAAEPAVRTA